MFNNIGTKQYVHNIINLGNDIKILSNTYSSLLKLIMYMVINSYFLYSSNHPVYFDRSMLSA